MNKLDFLTTKEAKKALSISDCDLAHIRIAGKLVFIKKGNSFLYLQESIESYKSKIK